MAAMYAIEISDSNHGSFETSRRSLRIDRDDKTR
jgi:hypothetical protein